MAFCSLAALALATTALPALAATLGPSLSFDQALGLSAQAPSLGGSARALTVKRDFDRRIAPLTLNPSLSVQPGYRLAPKGDREPELVVELVQPWNVAGHGRARRATAVAEEDVLAMELRARALEQRLGAARAWIDVWTAERVLAEAVREEAIAAELERLIARALAVAAATRADLAEARAFHAEARLLVAGAEGEVHDRGLELAREVASAEARPLRTAGDLPTPVLPPPSAAERVIAAAAELPGVRLGRLAATVERAREVEEHAARGTLLQLGAVLQRDAPGGLVLSGLVRVTPPLADRGERERGVAAANAARLDGDARQAALGARVEMAMALHEVEHTGELEAELRDELVPASREGAEARRRIFQAGEATLLEVLQAERTAVAAASRLERARGAHAWARVKLWLLLAALDGRTP